MQMNMLHGHLLKKYRMSECDDDFLHISYYLLKYIYFHYVMIVDMKNGKIAFTFLLWPSIILSIIFTIILNLIF